MTKGKTEARGLKGSKNPPKSSLSLLRTVTVMAQFNDLPIDVLPIILQNLMKPVHLASSRLVNRSFNQFAVSQLFEHIFVFAWHKQAKTRVNESS